MERLTGRTSNGVAYLYNMAAMGKAVSRLTAYEDTGLTPEEVANLIERSTPRKIVVETEPDREYVDFICPRCEEIISQLRKGLKIEGAQNRYVAMYMSPYHDSCGQRIDWGNAKEDYEVALAGKDGSYGTTER